MREDEFFDRIYRRKIGDRYIPEEKIKRDDIDSWMILTGAYWVF
jgi:hypothetical protein